MSPFFLEMTYKSFWMFQLANTSCVHMRTHTVRAGVKEYEYKIHAWRIFMHVYICTYTQYTHSHNACTCMYGNPFFSICGYLRNMYLHYIVLIPLRNNVPIGNVFHFHLKFQIALDHSEIILLCMSKFL